MENPALNALARIGHTQDPHYLKPWADEIGASRAPLGPPTPNPSSPAQ
jgi:hypothetical protein